MTNHMWDGYWLLGNKTAWETMPPTVRDIVSKHLNAGALKQRQDVIQLNASLQKTLEGRGLAFNTADANAFRQTLKSANFYTEQKQYFGDEEWALMEKYTGKLA
jgi:TRAP-type C4-dicarboxylate transport system substrate-binding protein